MAGAMQGREKLPLFVVPHNIVFYSEDEKSHKQVITIYNPYDFELSYKVRCSAAEKYRVMDSEGIVNPRCAVDVLIRHQDICAKNENITDIFRINVKDFSQNKLLGYKDVTAELQPHKKYQSDTGSFHSMGPSHGSRSPQSAHTYAGSPPPPREPYDGTYQTWVWMLVAAVIFIIVSVFPTYCPPDQSSWLPEWLAVPYQTKLLLSCIGGMFIFNYVQQYIINTQ